MSPTTGSLHFVMQLPHSFRCCWPGLECNFRAYVASIQEKTGGIEALKVPKTSHSHAANRERVVKSSLIVTAGPGNGGWQTRCPAETERAQRLKHRAGPASQTDRLGGSILASYHQPVRQQLHPLSQRPFRSHPGQLRKIVAGG